MSRSGWGTSLNSRAADAKAEPRAAIVRTFDVVVCPGRRADGRRRKGDRIVAVVFAQSSWVVDNRTFLNLWVRSAIRQVSEVRIDSRLAFACRCEARQAIVMAMKKSRTSFRSGEGASASPLASGMGMKERWRRSRGSKMKVFAVGGACEGYVTFRECKHGIFGSFIRRIALVNAGVVCGGIEMMGVISGFLPGNLTTE